MVACIRAICIYLHREPRAMNQPHPCALIGLVQLRKLDSKTIDCQLHLALKSRIIRATFAIHVGLDYQLPLP